MNSACQSYREELHDPRGDDASHGHPEACPECAEYAVRAERAVRGLAELEALEAPVELDGMVVAALQAGVREGRAVRAVSELERQALPEPLVRSAETEAEIAAELGGPFDRERVQVPSVLDRLVHEELADPIKVTVRRAVSSLPREQAPAELDARVHGDLLAPPASTAAPRFGRRLMLLGTSIAAGLLALLFLRTGPEPRTPSFRLEAATLEDIEVLDPFAREVVSSLGGGLLSVKEL